MDKFTHHRYLIIFLIMTILSVPFMGRGLFETSEGRYARVAQTMVQNNDYLMPKLNGQTHLTKPPLTYWFIAVGINLFGENTFGARFIHTIAWILLGLIIVRIGSELATPQTGMLAGLIFATSLFPSLGSWSLTTDPLLVTFQAFYFLSLLRYEKEKTLLNAFIFWLMVGLAFQTKGPIALLPILFLCLKWKSTLRELLKTHLWIVGVLVGLSWYLLLEFQNPGILLKLINNELILRSTTDVSGRNAFWWAPFVVYGAPFLVGWGLWPFLMDKNRLVSEFMAKSWSWQKAMMFWVLISLVMFSLIQSRLSLYILPISIPMSLLLADFLRNTDRVTKIALANFVLIFCMKSYGSFIYQSPDNSEQVAAFAGPLIKKEKLHLCWEKRLFGIEYYLPNNYRKESDPYTYDFSQPTWILYQERKKQNFAELVAHKNLQILQTHAFLKWRLAKIGADRSTHVTTNTKKRLFKE